MTDAVRFLMLLPVFLALSALGGGLVYLLGPPAFALLVGAGKAFGEAFQNVEWRQDKEEKFNRFDEYDINNPYYYAYELDRINRQYEDDL